MLLLLGRGQVVVHGGRRRVGGTVGWPGVVARRGLPVARCPVVAVLPRAPALAVGRRLPQLLLLLPGWVVQVVRWNVVRWWCVVGWQVVPAAVLDPWHWVWRRLPVVR